MARLVRVGPDVWVLGMWVGEGREGRESLRSMCQSCFQEKACHHVCVCFHSFIHSFSSFSKCLLNVYVKIASTVLNKEDIALTLTELVV